VESNNPEAAQTPEETESESVDEAITSLSQANLDLLEVLKDAFREFDPQPGALDDLPQVTIKPEDIQRVCRLAKDDPGLGMTQLSLIACVDYKEYFQMVYILHCLEPDRTAVIKTDVSYETAALPSVTSVWRAADWYEREAHDLFGVHFEGHPDLAPLLLYEGFEGYPGRKEYPFNDYQEF
jgi:NADH-quinone oxidoreductase subunit C